MEVSLSFFFSGVSSSSSSGGWVGGGAPPRRRGGPARVEGPRYDAGSHRSRFGLVLIEGRNRQIRRSLEALGHPVVRLIRVRMGPLRLGRLGRGMARALEDEERRALLAERSGR